MPIFFQAALGASPLRSSVDQLPQTTLVAPSALANGIIVQITHRYIPINVIGFSLMMVGTGIMSLFTAHVNKAQLVCYQIVGPIGTGLQVNSDLVSLA